MESWKYASDGKGFVLSDELGSTPNAVARSKKMLMGLDLKVPSNYENNMPISGRRAMENQGFMELGFSGMTQKPLPDNPTRGLLGGKIGTGRVNSSSCMITPSAFVEGNPSSMSQDLPLIDLKLGSLADHRDPQNGKSTMLMPRSYSVVSHAPSKRARSTILNPQTPLCQVHGCNLDLSSSKDYHKRHKVCDVHSKTSKVIVNGIEQRFCQQCSRFHLLAEFDNGKRSCRKRLAGHNERRRKPKLDNHSGNRLLETLIPRTSFIFSDILPNSILRPESCETGIWRMDMKVEDKAIYNPQSAMPTTEGHLLSKTLLPIYKMENSCSSIHANGIVTAKSSILSENNNCYAHNLAGSDSIMSSLFENNSSKAGDLTVFNLESNVEGLSGVSDSGCALSLLSSQSQNSSDHLSEIPMDQPLNIHGGHAYFTMGQIPEMLFGVTSQVSTSAPSNRFSSSQMNSTEVDQLGSVLISGARNTLNHEVHTNGIFAGSEFLNDKKHRFSPEHGCTVDMLQLSSQLQRVEHQRQYMQGQQQNDAFCFLPIT